MRVSKFDSNGSLAWSQAFSANAGGNVHVGGLAIDGNGNAVIAGSAFNGSANGYDLFVVKYSPGGTKLWQQLFNGAASLYDAAAAVVINSADEIFVGGATFQSGLNVNALARCYSPSGSLKWSQTFDHIGLTDGILNLLLDGNLLNCTGFAQTGLNSWEFLGIRYDAADGSLVNSQVTNQGGVSIDRVADAVTDAAGNIYITGALGASGQGLNIRTVKLNSSLAVVWTANFDGPASKEDAGQAVAVDAAGNVFVAGYATATNRDFVLLKYSSAGSLVWQRTLMGQPDGDDAATDLEIDAAGLIHVCGHISNHENRDQFVAVFDGNGHELWSETRNGLFNGDDEASGLRLETNGDFYLVGHEKSDPTVFSSSPTGGSTTTMVKYRRHILVVPTGELTTSPFIQNSGQLLNSDDSTATDVRFYSQQSYPNVFIGDGRVSYVFSHIDTIPASQDTMTRIDLTFENLPNGHDLVAVGLEKEAFFHNYYLGHIPEGRERVPVFDKILMPDIWPNIDAIYGQGPNGLFMRFICKPGSDPADITLKFSGQTALSQQTDGSLLLKTALENLVLPVPTASVLVSNSNTAPSLTPAWEVGSGGQVFLQVGSFDVGEDTLVIKVGEPEWPEGGGDWWSTYYGFTGNDLQTSVEFDEVGDIYTTGRSMSINFPVVGIVVSPMGKSDITANRFDINGYPKWFVMIGSDGAVNDDIHEKGFDISIGKDDFFYIGGIAASPWPLTMMPNPNSGGFQENNYLGGQRGCILKLFKEDAKLAWATFFGDPSASATEEGIIGVKALADGGVAVIGYSELENLPSLPPSSWEDVNLTGNPFAHQQLFLQPEGGMFIASFDKLEQEIWATKFGPAETISSDASIPHDITEDSQGNLFVVGRVIMDNSQNDKFPWGPNFAQPISTPDDGYLVKFSKDRRLLWSTYLGGTGSDYCSSVAIGPNDFVFFLGTTTSDDFVGMNPFSGFSDAYYGIISNDGSSFQGQKVGCRSAMTSKVTFGDPNGDGSGGNGLALNKEGHFVIVGSAFISSTWAGDEVPTAWPDPKPDWFFSKAASSGWACFMSYYTSYAAGPACSIYGGFKDDHANAAAIRNEGDENRIVFVGRTASGVTGATPPNTILYPTNDPFPADNDNYFDATGFTSSQDGIITCIKSPPFSVDNHEYQTNRVGLSCFPVPCNELLNIELAECLYQSALIQVQDPTGRITLSKEISLKNGQFTLDTRQFIDGFYFLTVQVETVRFASKFIKISD